MNSKSSLGCLPNAPRRDTLNLTSRGSGRVRLTCDSQTKLHGSLTKIPFTRGNQHSSKPPNLGSSGVNNTIDDIMHSISSKLKEAPTEAEHKRQQQATAKLTGTSNRLASSVRYLSKSWKHSGTTGHGAGSPSKYVDLTGFELTAQLNFSQSSWAPQPPKQRSSSIRDKLNQSLAMLVRSSLSRQANRPQKVSELIERLESAKVKVDTSRPSIRETSLPRLSPFDITVCDPQLIRTSLYERSVEELHPYPPATQDDLQEHQYHKSQDIDKAMTNYACKDEGCGADSTPEEESSFKNVFKDYLAFEEGPVDFTGDSPAENSIDGECIRNNYPGGLLAHHAVKSQKNQVSAELIESPPISKTPKVQSTVSDNSISKHKNKKNGSKTPSNGRREQRQSERTKFIDLDEMLHSENLHFRTYDQSRFSTVVEQTYGQSDQLGARKERAHDSGQIMSRTDLQRDTELDEDCGILEESSNFDDSSTAPQTVVPKVKPINLRKAVALDQYVRQTIAGRGMTSRVCGDVPVAQESRSKAGTSQTRHNTTMMKNQRTTKGYQGQPNASLLERAFQAEDGNMKWFKKSETRVLPDAGKPKKAVLLAKSSKFDKQLNTTNGIVPKGKHSITRLTGAEEHSTNSLSCKQPPRPNNSRDIPLERRTFADKGVNENLRLSFATGTRPYQEKKTGENSWVGFDRKDSQSPAQTPDTFIGKQIEFLKNLATKVGQKN